MRYVTVCSVNLVLWFQAAAALLFGQMVACGVSCEVQPEEMLQACLAVFTDLAEVSSKAVPLFSWFCGWV